MVLVLIYFLFCLLVAILGAHRPLGFWGYFVSSFILTPIIGLLLIAAAGESRKSRSDHHE